MKHITVKLISVAAALAVLCACAARTTLPSASASSRLLTSRSSADASKTSESAPAPWLSVETPDKKAHKIYSNSKPVSLQTLTVSSNSDQAPLRITVKSIPEGADYTSFVSVKLKGSTVLEGSLDDLKKFIPSRNGTYEVSVTVTRDSKPLLYQFKLDCAYAPEVSFESPRVALGEALVVHVKYADGLDVAAQTDGALQFTPHFYENGGIKTALIPARLSLTPGTYPLTITAGKTTFRYDLQIEAREFEVQHLTVDETTTSETIESQQANNEWNQKIEPLKLVSEPVRYWEGTFVQPVQGPITTQFGMTRYTNNNPTPSRHAGIDIAAGRGTPIAAANSGKVLFADFIQLTGNTVVIEHGMGLKSWYYHMDGLNVKAGDQIEKGDQVGVVGSTGFSTGPHLHFAMSVNNIFINPWTAFEKGLD